MEWTFPISYKKLYFDKSLPETEMLMRVIDELKPELMASLHNAGFSGVYYYVSDGDQALFDLFHQIPAWEDLPLQLGEAEVPWAQPLAPAVFPMLETSAAYDHIEANGGEPRRRIRRHLELRIFAPLWHLQHRDRGRLFRRSAHQRRNPD